MMCSSSSVGVMFMMGGDGTTGPTGPTGPTTPQYTESCDDLSGDVIERFDGPISLASCKQKCNADSGCLAFIRGPELCQLHGNKNITNVSICDRGLKVYRK